MDLDNKNIGSFPVEMTGDHTFLSYSGDDPEDVIDRFPDIDSVGKTVVITDPYLFTQQDEDNKKLAIKALTKTGASRIIYCQHDHPNRRVFGDIQANLNGIILEYKKLEKCHDRFWYCVESKQGFYMGGSLNTIGKKTCAIDWMSEETKNDFIQMPNDQGVIHAARS